MFLVALGPTHHFSQWVSGAHSPEVKWPWHHHHHEVDHFPPSGTKVKNEWNYTCTHATLIHGMGRVYRTVVLPVVYDWKLSQTWFIVLSCCILLLCFEWFSYSDCIYNLIKVLVIKRLFIHILECSRIVTGITYFWHVFPNSFCANFHKVNNFEYVSLTL
jgi:hypothetical protein